MKYTSDNTEKIRDYAKSINYFLWKKAVNTSRANTKHQMTEEDLYKLIKTNVRHREFPGNFVLKLNEIGDEKGISNISYNFDLSFPFKFSILLLDKDGNVIDDVPRYSNSFHIYDYRIITDVHDLCENPNKIRKIIYNLLEYDNAHYNDSKAISLVLSEYLGKILYEIIINHSFYLGGYYYKIKYWELAEKIGRYFINKYKKKINMNNEAALVDTIFNTHQKFYLSAPIIHPHIGMYIIELLTRRLYSASRMRKCNDSDGILTPRNIFADDVVQQIRAINEVFACNYKLYDTFDTPFYLIKYIGGIEALYNNNRLVKIDTIKPDDKTIKLVEMTDEEIYTQFTTKPEEYFEVFKERFNNFTGDLRNDAIEAFSDFLYVLKRYGNRYSIFEYLDSMSGVLNANDTNMLFKHLDDDIKVMILKRE